MARHGRPEEEMFLDQPAEGDDSPTVEPLRIFKPQSPQPASVPPAEPSRYPGPSSNTSFPLPPGASSSAAPLPYPSDDDDGSCDGEDHPNSRPAAWNRPVYAADGRRPSGNSAYSSPTGVQSERPNDTSPRLEPSPVEKRGPGLAERRGTAPRPLPGALSPSSPTPDDGDLFARPLGNNNQRPPAVSNDHLPNLQKQQQPYYPPPRGHSSNSVSGSSDRAGPPDSDQNYLRMPIPSGVNRLSSTASTSTTKASRGSPPPPETPIVEPGSIPGGGIEARYAAAGISGTATLSSLQSSAAAQRLAQYRSPPPGHPATQPAPARPWTPTEAPGQQPHGPPVAYQGSEPVVNQASSPESHSSARTANSGAGNPQVGVVEQDLQRMHMSPSPPPAYSSINPNASSQAHANEKQRTEQPAPRANSGPVAQAAQAPKNQDPAASGLASPALQHPGHPAFANDPRPHSAAAGSLSQQTVVQTPSPFQGAGPTSPPPLPEGWISHLDQNSGQYYYIHLATMATQWEFPKGPNPLHVDVAPLSPAASTYGNPLASPSFGGKQSVMHSPMFPPQTPGYAESIMSVAASANTGYTGPPPSAGIEMFKVQPTNGVYFGPYLRYVNMDIEKGIWLGSILIVTDAPQPPTIHIHLSVDLSPNPRQLAPVSIHTHQRWQFYKYDVDLQMGEGATDRWTYAVTSHLGCTRYEFVVAGRHETNWRFIAHSGNDFAAGTSQSERTKLGGLGFMWKDVLQKNVDCGGFHAQLGLGDQIYGDRLWKEVPLLKQWLAMQGKENRKNARWTARHEEEVNHAYFHFYTSHFDQPFLREAFAQIPHVCQIDDHDIFDGYGSYPDYMQSSQMFKNIGRIAIDMYLLFQHHTTLEVLRTVHHDLDLFTVTGSGWHFVKFFGPALAVVGADLRSERSQGRVLAGPTYQGLFPKIAMLPPSVQHCILMLSVPLVYPRLDAVEGIANTFTTGKKAVNTTYNVFGKVTSSVAGIVGGKEVVAQGFKSVKQAVGKSGLMSNVLNQFGEVDISEVLKDMWTHESKDLERTYLIRTLQGIALQKGVRMTFFSGDVNAAGAGLVHDPTHPNDHRTMYQIITSPIVAAPASGYILKLLQHNQQAHYVPANGHRSTHEVSDTKEDMMDIFHADANGAPRDQRQLMGRRNYVAVLAYDPDLNAHHPHPQYQQGMPNGGGAGLSKLSLAVDFVVQAGGDGTFPAPTKYGPVVVPHLEFGR